MNIISILSITILTAIYVIIQITGIVESSESKLLQQQQEQSEQQQPQNQTFLAKLTGNNTIPPVNTNSTGIVKFMTNTHYHNNNELYYEINLTNIHNDVKRIDVHIGKKNENGPALVTLYQTTISPLSEICCKSADSEYEKTTFFFNGTIFPQAFEFGPLASSKNITDLIRIFNNGSAYVEVYTYQPNSLSLFDMDSEIRGQVTSE